MTRVSRPLFSDSARGDFAGLGTYRMGRHGPEFIRLATGQRTPVATLTPSQTRFQEAVAAFKLLTPEWTEEDGRRYFRRNPRWALFWAQWVEDHPL